MKSHTSAVVQALFVVFLWATSWVFVKIGLQDIPPVTFAGLRYFLAFLCLLVILIFNRSRSEIKNLSQADWLRFILLGILLYAGTQGAVFVALAYLPAVTVNLMWSFSSVVIALLGAALLSEQPRILQWAGMILAVLGTFIYFYPVDIPQHQTTGLVVAVLGVLANAFASILGREINRASRHSPLLVTVISMGVGSILLLAAGITLETTQTLDLQSWLIILWLALVNTAFAFTLWNHTLRTLTAMESSIINGTMLVWVALFAVLFLGETITTKEAVGLAATSLGTIIVQVRKTNPHNRTGNQHSMLTMDCKAILFDLDGTLVDSASRVERLWLNWGSKRGIDTDYLLEVMHGRRADETIQLVAPHLSIREEFLALEEDEISDMDGVRPYSSAGDLLGKLSPRQWAIVTSGSLRVASARMRHVGLPKPEVFITADDIRAGKPAPDGYLLAADRLQVNPSDCVVIEDAPAGIQAGKAAGMRVIAVTANLSGEALSQADAVVRQLEDIHLQVTSQGIQILLKQ